MTKGKVTVLGINGHIGHHAAKALAAAGYDVTGFGRSNRNPLAGVRFVQGDAARLDEVKAVIADADIVFNALNLPYDQWGNGRAVAQIGVVIEAMGNSGKTLLHPGTIYNYAATDRRITPSMPQHPHTPRGAIRAEQEAMLVAASKAGKFQTIVLRGGDFYAPDSTNDWFDQAILMDVAKGKIHHLGPLDLAHGWAYLPDLGKAFAVLADRRSEFGAFENFHYNGHFVTHGALMTAIQKAWPTPLKVSAFPWIVFQALGLTNGVLRDLVKMRYLWNSPMEMVDPRLDAILGPDFGTPFDDAVAEMMQPFAQRAAA